MRYEEMSREDLLREIGALQVLLGDDVSLSEVVHELQVHQEEVKAQQTQLLEAQQALEESRDRYADLFDFAPIGYATLCSSGVIRNANLAAGQMLGIERGRLIGFALLVHVAHEDRRIFLEHLGRCRGGEDPVSSRLRLRRRDGRTFSAHLVSRRDGQAEDPRWNTALLDMTEQDSADEERRGVEEERLRLLGAEEGLRASAAAKDRFLAILSHELRTPLTPILLTISLIEQRSDLPDEVRAELEKVRRNATLEARLIDDLLDTTRIARDRMHLEREAVDLHAAIGDVVAICAPDCQLAGLEMEVEAAAEVAHVHGDPTRLRQVLWNLMKNAVRHTPSGGKICVRSSNPAADRVRIAVEDTGIGIQRDFLERIFDPFQQASEPGDRVGLGLGLAICKGILDAHGGELRVHSEGRGRGACFEIELATSAPASEHDAEPTARRHVEGRRLLLVEDHADTATSLAMLLEMEGHEVLLAHSFADALRHRGESFDVLVTDIGLPDGDGIGLLGALGGPARCGAIALSGYGSEQDRQRSADAGFARHLVKPVAPDDLMRAIDEVCAQVLGASA